MRRLVIGCLLLCSAMSSLRAAEPLPQAVKDPFYGQVLFDFYQKNYFSAITHLRAAQHQKRLPHHAGEAELLLGSLYLSYGMQKNAETSFNQLLERQSDSLDPLLRNRIWLALAEIYKTRGYGAKAEEILGRISTPLSPEQQDEKRLLEATLLNHQQRYSDAAVVLTDFKRDTLERDYVQYNLAMQQIRQGHEIEGRQLLEPLARFDVKSDAERFTFDTTGGSERSALRDKANIALGYSYLRREQFAQARVWFEQVGLHGPFVSQALLGLGWVEVGLGNGATALSIWLSLTQRSAAEPAVLEGLLAIPYTFAQLGDRRQAADHYKKAINIYNSELNVLQGIISGMDFVALAQELVDDSSNPEAGWQWRPEINSSAMLGPYIYQVMAGYEFQETLRNYRDLLFLDKNLLRWQSDLDVYEAMVDTRQAAYEERLPKTQSVLATLDGNSLQQQRYRHAKRLEDIEVVNDASALAASDEQSLMAGLARIEARLKRLEGSEDLSEQRRKYELLKGMLLWQLETEYPARLWQVKRQLEQLDEVLVKSDQQRRSLTAALPRISNDLTLYRQVIKITRSQVVGMHQQARVLVQQHEEHLKQLMMTALQGTEARIKHYQGQALFGAAQIYDRALHAPREQQ